MDTHSNDSMRDWLNLHNLSREELMSSLAWIPADNVQNGSWSNCGPMEQVLDLEAARSLIKDALMNGLPFMSFQVKEIFERVVLFAKSDRPDIPVTVHSNAEHQPEIHVDFNGSPDDVLTLAHEYGHAVQLSYSNSNPIRPITRETAAFIAELCLLRHCKFAMPNYAGCLQNYWHQHDLQYRNANGSSLSASLENLESPYLYVWNYPIARLLSEAIWNEAKASELEAIFLGELDIALRLAKTRKQQKQEKLSVIPPLKFSSGSRKESELQLLGTKFVLDTLGAAGHEKMSIENYVSEFSGFYSCGGLRVSYDQSDQPYGYCAIGKKSKERVFPIVCRNNAPENTTGSEDGAPDIYTMIGSVLTLLANSKYHKQQYVMSYLAREVMPAITSRQCRFYFDHHGAPIGFVTWAWICEETQTSLLEAGRSLSADEWKNGDLLFFNDWVTPRGHVRTVKRDLEDVCFPNEIASGMRRNIDGSVRKICWMRGANRKGALKQQQA